MIVGLGSFGHLTFWQDTCCNVQGAKQSHFQFHSMSVLKCLLQGCVKVLKSGVASYNMEVKILGGHTPPLPPCFDMPAFHNVA